jgi:cardiolipin synthase A/B
MDAVKLVVGNEFLPELTRAVAKARNRIWIQSMLFESGKNIGSIIEQMKLKASQGVDVRLVIDWVAGRYVGGKLDLWPVWDDEWREHKKKVQEGNKAEIAGLKQAGVKVTIKNYPQFWHHFLPFMGRNHMKMYVVDETVWLGGVNFTDKSFTWLDFVVKFSQPEMTDKIAAHFDPQQDKGNYSIRLNSEYELLIDNGVMGQSIILDRALKLIRNAGEEILFVSQLLPVAQVADSLISKANNGVRVKIITSQADDGLFKTQPHKVMHWWARKKMTGRENLTIIHAPGKVHAKYLQVDKKTAIFGSHNLVETGVWLGTAEIAVETTDPDLISQTDRYFGMVS